MSIVFLILKIIGFTLLGILALLLLLILLLLFVPLRYKVKAHYDEQAGPVADVRFSWLLPVVSGKVLIGDTGILNNRYDAGKKTTDPSVAGTVTDAFDTEKKDEKPKIPMEGGVKVFFFRVANFFPTEEEKAAAEEKKEAKRKKKEEKEAKKAAKQAAKDAKKGKTSGDESKESDDPTLNQSLLQDKENNQEDNKDNKTDNSGGTDGIGSEDEETEGKFEGTFLDKLRYMLLAIPDLLAKLLDKLCELQAFMADLPDEAGEKTKALADRFRAYHKVGKRFLCIWEKHYTKEALRKGKRAILRILKDICPRKGGASIAAGMEDIATTGQICGYYGMLVGMFYPFIGKRVVFTPDFEKKTYSGDAFLTGRFRLVSCLDALWLYFFDKDVKRLKAAIEKAKAELP